MATFTFKPYVPKQLKGNIQKPISKSIPRQPSFLDKSFQIDSDVLIEVPPALGGAAGNNDWCQKVVGGNETRVQDVQVFGNDLAGTRAASIAEKDSSDNNTDNDFPTLTYPPPPKYKHISTEKSLSMKDTTEIGNDQALGDSIFGSRGPRAPESHDKPIELGSYNKSEGDGSNHDTGHARRMVDSGQPGSRAFILEHLPTLPNSTASEHDDSDIGIDNTKSPRTAKRQRPCSSILPHTPPLPHNEDGKGSRENINHSDPEQPGDGDSWSKRRKISAPPGGGTAPNSRHNRSQRSPSPISEEDEDDGTLSGSANSSAARTSPASESAPPTNPQLYPQLIDADQDWEVHQIIGREDVDGVLHYLVDWCPTLLPEPSLGHAKELVDKFEARLRAQRLAQDGRVVLYLERGEQAVVQADASGDQQPKRRRGRPRKQM